MCYKGFRFKLASMTCAALAIVILSVGATNSIAVQVDVTIADLFTATPIAGPFPVEISEGPDGFAGGIGFVPAALGGFQSFGLPDFTLNGIATLFGSPLPSAWPTATPIVFAGAVEFQVDSVSGDFTSVLADVPQTVTIDSDDLEFDFGGLTVAPVDFSFRTSPISLSGFLGDADGWVPGNGSLFGIPFNGWVSGFTLDDLSGRGLISFITDEDGGLSGLLPPDEIGFATVTSGTAVLAANPIPEPTSLGLLGLGMLSLMGYSWWRGQKRADRRLGFKNNAS